MTMRVTKLISASALLVAACAAGALWARVPDETTRRKDGARPGATGGRGLGRSVGPPASGGAASAAPASAPEQNKVLEDVHKQEEVSASGKGLTYDPGDRRDPFISPAEANKLEDVGKCEGEGMECWLITEVNLVGVLSRRSGGVRSSSGRRVTAPASKRVTSCTTGRSSEWMRPRERWCSDRRSTIRRGSNPTATSRRS